MICLRIFTEEGYLYWDGTDFWTHKPKTFKTVEAANSEKDWLKNNLGIKNIEIHETEEI